ncbi:hypothetical protein FQ775_11685 [Nitratireductor mangrovi]|uniref:Uncharacterized protein n=2 Tax=Nitratireductor mangrovi TaxID=2599600 RepID=A0A5B8KZE8_9HYPH|nr:hypothetical protein FQ775_11685 [Nitratireductor mangrovi]
MRRTVRLGFATMLLSGLMAGAAAAHDLTPRDCTDHRILSRITSKFRHQVRHVPHLPDVEIVDFRRVHERRYLPFRENRPVARRYCGATAVLSDGRKRTVWYLIEDRMGFAGIGDGVEFCVSGFDRWMVYNGRCRVLR